jgi:outer membrane receptor protein involved in Fe transport
MVALGLLCPLWAQAQQPTAAPDPGPDLVEDREDLSVDVRATSRAPETASSVRLTRADIEAAPHRNAEEVLRQVPGLTLVQHGSEGKGYQFFLRGFDATHGADLALRLEDLPLNEWSNIHAQGYLDLSLIIPEVIQSVQVTKGPFSLDQGAFAMAGSAQYNLGAPTQGDGWGASYTLGTTGRHRGLAVITGQQGQGFAAIEATRDQGFGQNRWLERATFNSRAQLWRQGHDDLSLLLLAYHGQFGLPSPLRNQDVQDGQLGFYDSYDQQAQGSSSRAVAALRYRHGGAGHQARWTAWVQQRHLELLENFTGFLIHPTEGDRRQQQHQALGLGLRGQHSAALSARWTLLAGGGWRGQALEQREDNVGRQLQRLSARRHLEAQQWMAHTWLGLRWRPVDNLSLEGGARADLLRVDTVDKLAQGSTGGGTLWTASPRLTGRWAVNPSLRLFSAYGRGLRPPEARAFSSFEADREGIAQDVITNADPALTTSDAVEVGGRWDPHEAFGVSLSGFGTWIARESIFDHVSGTSLELNGTRRLGTELVLYSDPAPWLSLSADVTWVQAQFVESGHQVPLAPWLVSGLRAQLSPTSRLQIGARGLLVAPRPLPHGATGATLLRLDATARYRWRHWWLGLQAENLSAARLREGEYHYASHWRPGSAASEVPTLHTTAGPPLNLRFTLGVEL